LWPFPLSEIRSSAALILASRCPPATCADFLVFYRASQNSVLPSFLRVFSFLVSFSLLCLCSLLFPPAGNGYASWPCVTCSGPFCGRSVILFSLLEPFFFFSFPLDRHTQTSVSFPPFKEAFLWFFPIFLFLFFFFFYRLLPTRPPSCGGLRLKEF